MKKLLLKAKIWILSKVITIHYTWHFYRMMLRAINELEEFIRKDCKHESTSPYYREYLSCEECNLILKPNKTRITRDESIEIHYAKIAKLEQEIEERNKKFIETGDKNLLKES